MSEWVNLGCSDVYKVLCQECHKTFVITMYPATGGDPMMCPNCGAEAYGTYDSAGEYMLEWYANEEE